MTSHFPLKIVADENIPCVHDFFEPFGTIHTLPGRSLTAQDLADADILLVRSVTPVNAELLGASRVKFVGTCTIGVDHLDESFLKKAGIEYASAPGCNAGGVLQYVIAAVSQLLPEWRSRSFGVVGNGNVGQRLCRALLALGVDCIAYDPFQTRQQFAYLRSLDEVLKREVVCFHAPYTRGGAFPSHHLLNADTLKKLRPDALLLNAGRGGVIDNHALSNHIDEHPELRVVLDVWESEPDVSMALLQQVNIATPHIAGYSFEGRIMGTAMIYSALAHYLGKDKTQADLYRAQQLNNIFGAPKTLHPADVNEAIHSSYDVRADDRRMREAMQSAGQDGRGVAFDKLRKTYPERHEFAQHAVEASNSNSEALRALEFSLV